MKLMVDSVPAWSTDALFARDIFFGEFNDVNFYVEDEDQENLYLEVLNKLFDKIKINQIFPLGGKANVLVHAADLTSRRHGKAIYIVDKDFDDLLGNKVHKNNVFYLSKYCIENFLIEERALLEIAVEAQPKKKRNKLISELMVGDYISESIKHLDILFRMFFIVQRLDLEMKNCDCAPEVFSVDGKPHKLDMKKIEAYRTDMTNKILGKGLVQSKVEVDELIINAYLPLPDSERDIHISGKFVMAMLMHYIKMKIKCGNISLDSFAFRLAKNSDFENLYGLRDEILAYLNSETTIPC